MGEHRGLTVFLMIGGAILVATLGYLLFSAARNAPLSVNSFDDCMKAGNKILDTSPAQCLTPEGKTFVQEN